MAYQCPKGHQSTDADYCSECGALIGKPNIAVKAEPVQSIDVNKAETPKAHGEICPDCGTEREGNARFCEVCRHDFQENKTGVAEAIVASQKASIPQENANRAEGASNIEANKAESNAAKNGNADINKSSSPVNSQDENINKTSNNVLQNAGAGSFNTTVTDDYKISQKLNIIISVDKDKVSSWDGESPIKPDTVDRIFPLDLDENLVGRRSNSKGIYPEIEINDPGVSHRHLKFIKQADGSFAALELGSSNGTEINGSVLEPGINTPVKTGDELTLGIWTRLKIVAR